MVREDISPNSGSSFYMKKVPMKKDYFFWHFHPEYEIVYIEGVSGTRHVGDHVSAYENSDLVFIGPYVPHLNFDYGVQDECLQIVIQMKDDFLGKAFLEKPELQSINSLFEKAIYGLSFYGETKKQVGEMLTEMQHQSSFEQLISLLKIFQTMALSTEVTQLNARPVIRKAHEHEQQRLHTIYEYVEQHYQGHIDVNEVAEKIHLSIPAFSRFFKKHSQMTFTDFVNQYRINQAKNFLLQDMSVSETCYAVGFDSLSYFNKLFKKLSGSNPSEFKKQYSPTLQHI